MEIDELEVIAVTFNLEKSKVIFFPFPQTLPEEVDGPKWQQDWGLIGNNPGVSTEQSTPLHSPFFAASTILDIS